MKIYTKVQIMSMPTEGEMGSVCRNEQPEYYRSRCPLIVVFSVGLYSLPVHTREFFFVIAGLQSLYILAVLVVPWPILKLTP